MPYIFKIDRELIITIQEAEKLKLYPLTIPIFEPGEYWILGNVAKDLNAGKINWAYVREYYRNRAGISIWRSSGNFKK